MHLLGGFDVLGNKPHLRQLSLNIPFDRKKMVNGKATGPGEQASKSGLCLPLTCYVTLVESFNPFVPQFPYL